MRSILKTTAAAVLSTCLATSTFANCIDLDSFIPPGPFFGAAHQISGNTTLYLIPTQFWWDPATPASGGPNAEMMGNNCFGGNASLFLNNTNLSVFIVSRDPEVKEFQFNYCDFGGFENVSAAWTMPPQFIGEIQNGVPTPLPDNWGNPVDIQQSLSNPEGKLVFTGTQDYIRFAQAGGQEFMVQSICVN